MTTAWIDVMARWDPVEIVGVGRPWLDPTSAQRSWDQAPNAQILLRVLEEQLGAAGLRSVRNALLRGLPSDERYDSIRKKIFVPTALSLDEIETALTWPTLADEDPRAWGPRAVLRAIFDCELWKMAYYAERFAKDHNLASVVREFYPIERFTR